MFHKVFVISGLNWISFSNGFVFGHVTNMIGSLQKKEEGIDLRDGQISLIASTMTTTCLVGFGLAAAISDTIGRRWPFILFSIPTVINWIILYHAREMFHFMLSRVIAGSSVGALLTLDIFVISEYTPPNTRAFHVNMVSTVVPAIGTGLGHAIGNILHWRNVTLIGIFVTSLGIILPYFWVESPHWLASKGRIQECETAFRKLHGNKLNSERELQILIKMETTKLKMASETNRKSTMKRLLVAFKRKYFWKLLILSFVLHIYYAAAGKLIFTILGTVILEQITGTSDILLFTLLVDGFIFIGSCMSCVMIRKTSIRILLFSTGFTANFLLVVFSISYYFSNGQTYFNWINVTLLALYFIIVHAGPYPLVDALFSELFPLELKVYMFFISGFVLIAALTSTLILLPYVVASLGYHGLFLINATVMSMCLCYLWLMLPETKGKTLQEIEMYCKTDNFDVDDVLSREQIKSLI